MESFRSYRPFILRWAGLSLALLFLGADEGIGQTRCDCSEKVGSCNASISKKTNWITIVSDSQTCAMVVWHADGEPHVTTVIDGSEREEWLGPTANPELSIDSCSLCRDSQSAGASSEGEPAIRGWGCYDSGNYLACKQLAAGESVGDPAPNGQVWLAATRARAESSLHSLERGIYDCSGGSDQPPMPQAFIEKWCGKMIAARNRLQNALGTIGD